MPEAHGKVVRSEAGRTTIRFESAACSACHGCGSPARRDVALAVSAEGAVVASMSTFALMSILFFSLGLPLAGFVAGASFATIVGAGELTTALVGGAGLVVGILCCRRQTEESIEIEEVLND